MDQHTTWISVCAVPSIFSPKSQLTQKVRKMDSENTLQLTGIRLCIKNGGSER
jgi:hypothetical protein